MNATPPVGDRVALGAPHGAAAHQVRRGHGHGARRKVLGPDSLVDPVRLARFQGGRGCERRMDPERPGGEEDPGGGPGSERQSSHDLVGEAVVHDGPARAVDGHPVSGRGAVARQHENHLEAREGGHEAAVLLAESDQALRGHEREVHARLEDVPLLFGAVDEEALRVAHVVRDRPGVLRNEDERRMACEALAQAWQMLAEAGAEQQRRRADGAPGQDHHPGADPVLSGLPLRGRSLLARGLLGHANHGRSLLQAKHLGPGHDLHAAELGRR